MWIYKTKFDGHCHPLLHRVAVWIGAWLGILDSLVYICTFSYLSSSFQLGWLLSNFVLSLNTK
jgi:hypothetical protein